MESFLLASDPHVVGSRGRTQALPDPRVCLAPGGRGVKLHPSDTRVHLASGGRGVRLQPPGLSPVAFLSVRVAGDGGWGALLQPWPSPSLACYHRQPHDSARVTRYCHQATLPRPCCQLASPWPASACPLSPLLLGQGLLVPSDPGQPQVCLAFITRGWVASPRQQRQASTSLGGSGGSQGPSGGACLPEFLFLIKALLETHSQ